MKIRPAGSKSDYLFQRLVAAIIALGLAPCALAETIAIGGSGADLASMRLLAEAFQRVEPKISVKVLPNLGSGGGVKAVLAGKLDIALLTRALDDKETRHGLRKLHYARTPLVFAVTHGNPQAGIDRARLIEIYSGRNLRWKHGAPIRLVLRPNSDSDTLILKQSLPGIAPSLNEAYQRPGLPIAVTDQDAADAIETIPGAVGTSTLALLLAEKRKLKPLAVNGVVPSPATLASGAYPFAKELYFVLPAASPLHVQRFIAFVQSRQGAGILEKTGHFVIRSD